MSIRSIGIGQAIAVDIDNLEEKGILMRDYYQL